MRLTFVFMVLCCLLLLANGEFIEEFDKRSIPSDLKTEIRTKRPSIANPVFRTRRLCNNGFKRDRHGICVINSSEIVLD